MSRLKGMKIYEKLGRLVIFNPAIKYLKTRKEYVVSVPDVYMLMKFGNIEKSLVYISGEDLWKLIRLDNLDEYINFNEEQGELDDETYQGISLVQYLWYFSKNTIDQARRARGKWVFLKKRVPRGGRPVGSVAHHVVTEEEKERVQYLTDNFEDIVAKCVEHDWYEEYENLLKDTGRFTNKKECVRKWRELRGL